MTSLWVEEIGRSITFANKTYAAEFLCFQLPLKSKKDRMPNKVSSISEAEDIAKFLGVNDVKIQRGRSRGSWSTFYREDRRILLGHAAPVYIVCHELAHAAVGTGHGHDGHFRAQYLEFVARVLGKEWRDKLEESFHKMGLKAKFVYG